MAQPKYHRVLLKISGEALAGDAHRGLDFDVIGSVCDVVKQCRELGVQIGIVVGGGNFWRGLKDGGARMERTRADHMGMLATVINALAIADVPGADGMSRCGSRQPLRCDRIAEPYIRSKAIRHLEKGRVVVFGCGTGNPLLLDGHCGAALRAVGDRTPTQSCWPRISTASTLPTRAKDPAAVKYDKITYDEVLASILLVMD